MKRLTNRWQPDDARSTAVALGTFDGVHAGHRAVIQSAVNSGLPCVVFAVEPSPAGDGLLTDADKQEMIASLGAAYYLSVALDEIRDMAAEDFFQAVLRDSLHARLVCCGFNFHFGKNAAGDTVLLKTLCQQAGIEAQILPPVKVDGQPVSSTRIRQALADGKPERAAAMLGRPFAVTLPVVRGQRLGHKLGFPTLNQPWPPSLVLPRQGVYVVSAEVDGRIYPGVCNVGIRPTVGSDCMLAETHVIGLDQDLYGQTVTLRLLRFLRPERTFDSLATLQAAIAKDVEHARAVWQTEERDA